MIKTKPPFFCNKAVIFLLSFFAPMIINIGGEVSPSFLFLLATLPLWIARVPWKEYANSKRVVGLLSTLLVVQFVWSLFAQTDYMAQIKAMMITFSGLVYFLFYYMVYKTDTRLLKWAALGTFLASFVFINVLVERAGTDFGLWKFQIMPRIVSGAVLVLLFVRKRRIVRLFPWVMVGIGLLGIATGARSAGLIPLMSGVLALFIQSRRESQLRSLKKYILGGVVVLYACYTLLYVPNVLNGKITGGNSEQLKSVENPYNPANLLMIGRTDAIVPFIAFMDKPLTGWGYGTPDPGMKYNTLCYILKTDDSDYNVENFDTTIPAHSTWGAVSCAYGIVGFIIIFLLLWRVWKVLYKSLVVHDHFLLYRIYVTFMLTWNILFSPFAHMKTLPMEIAIVLVLSAVGYEAVSHNKEKV